MGGGDISEGEDIEVIELPLVTAMQMITNGKIRDGKTISPAVCRPERS
jgi:hypothetical protein